MYIRGTGNYVILPLSDAQLSLVLESYAATETAISGVYSVTTLNEENAQIWYSNGEYDPSNPGTGLYTNISVPFASEWIWPDEAVKLLKNIELTHNITYVGGSSGTAGKTYILMNGHTITGGYFVINPVSETTEIVSDTPDISSYFIAEGYVTTETGNGDGTYSYKFSVSE